jgi:DNA-binding NarL/FixJ family response regulator
MRVLIADDSDFMIDRLQQMLSRLENVEVIGSFHNGIDALNAILKLKSDMAVLDNKMLGLKE